MARGRQNAANPACSSAWPPVRSFPHSRLVREIDVMEGTVAITGSRPSSRRPTSTHRRCAMMSSASWQPTAALIPSSTTISGSRRSATGRATRSRTFSTSSSSSVLDEASVQAASFWANRRSSPARRLTTVSQSLA